MNAIHASSGLTRWQRGGLGSFVAKIVAEEARTRCFVRSTFRLAYLFRVLITLLLTAATVHLVPLEEEP